MTSTHAKYSPSAAHRWMRCPGSISLSVGFPDTSSPFAAEGTLAHEYAEYCLSHFQREGKYPGDLLPNVTPEMADFVRGYTDRIISNFKMAGPKTKLLVETKLDMSHILPNCFGTADAIICNGDVLEVHDLKYGTGVKVHAQGNEQLKLYALGALKLFPSAKTVHMYIHQPRLYHVSRSVITPADLENFAQEVVSSQSATAKEFVAGPTQCKFCKAKPICPTLASYAMKTVFDDFVDLSHNTTELQVKDINKLDLTDLSRILDIAPTVKKWCTTVESYATQLVEEGGHSIPSYALTPGRKGVRKWVDVAQAEQRLTQLGVTDVYTLKSPVQLDKEVLKQLVDLITQESTKSKLTKIKTND